MATDLNQLERELRDAMPEEKADLACALAAATVRRMSPSDQQDLGGESVRELVLTAFEAFESTDGRTPSITITREDDQPTRVHVHAVDGPFVVSTVHEELRRLGLDPVDLAHPVVGVTRDAAGGLVEIMPARSATRRETFLALDLQTRLDQTSADAVAKHLADVLLDAQRAMADFLPLKQRVAGIAMEIEATAANRYPAEEVAEVADFLRWLLDDHFVFLGYRSYDITGEGEARVAKVVPGQGLGILRDDESSTFRNGRRIEDLSPLQAFQATEGPLLNVSRTTRPSTVHRQVRMTYIGVQKVAADGTIVGEHRILGLLAQKAFVEPSSMIPVLRRKLREVLEAEDVVDHSHDERALRTLFDAFPKQELFETEASVLHQTMVQLLETSRRHEVRLVTRAEPNGRSLSALVTLPRERFSAELRTQVQELLAERADAATVDYQLSMTERDEPLLHFTLHLREGATLSLDADAVESEIRQLTRTFRDSLMDALTPERGRADAELAADQWCRVLPRGYTDTTPVEVAVADIEELEGLVGPSAVRMRMLDMPDERGEARERERLLRFRLYKAGEGVELSGFVPVLESLGLVVVEEQPHRIPSSPIWGELHMHDYGLRSEVGQVDITEDGPRLAAAAMSMWDRRCAVDSLNRLVLLAGMNADDVVVLRAIRRYLRQIGTTYTEATVNEALIEHPSVARTLVTYFEARFAPAAHGAAGDRPARSAEARQSVRHALEGVERLDQDRILRAFLGVVDATLRTNRWRHRPFLSLKIDSAKVPGVPKPVPYREIFVYSTAMEGVHLRGGPVARGGLRWSDRADDFRTEVLGLMKAQMTKNAVIVPAGSKGGFVLKHRPADPQKLRAEVEAQYRVFIRGLLDVTDNIVDGEVVHPDRVVCADDADPYLVVAADRGTATFSDIANSISADYGFWLDDAFASGGSQGYDHKAMGITARGAWVAVQRHFRELSIDVQTDAFTVVGVGDMSGDVFGNGMLRSTSTRLVAAFDHRDIFIDPTPDPAASYAERQRLFNMPRSSWQDYDRSLISEGGGVWSRESKSITLSPQAKEALRITEDELSPPELLHRILKAPADLLWFGGIGTYVKARGESNTDVGDRANDAIRVDGDEVSARVVGEGGNLAMTQRGRIQLSRRGGRCNTDATDNAAGVNTSDREVNLKILLGQAIGDGVLPAEDRNDLLASLTEDVGDQVLRDQYLQTWAISQELHAAPGGLGAYEQMMGSLERREALDRAVELLPDSAEIEERRDMGAGFTRPELAVLLAYAKIDVADQLLASTVVDQPVFDEIRRDYFPGDIGQRFAEQVGDHRLKRELVATVVANDVCNRMGITWVTRTAADLGTTAPEVVAAYWIARQLIGADLWWQRIEGLDAWIDPVLQLELKDRVDWLVDAFTRSYVRQARTSDIELAVQQDQQHYEEMYVGVADQPGVQATAIRRLAGRWMDLGIEDDLAMDLARLSELSLVPGVAATSRTTGWSVDTVAKVYALISERLPMAQMNSSLAAFEPHGRWERWQHRGLVDDVRRLHHVAARDAIATAGEEGVPAEVVSSYLAARAETVERAVGLARQARVEAGTDLNALAVAVRALSEIAA